MVRRASQTTPPAPAAASSVAGKALERVTRARGGSSPRDPREVLAELELHQAELTTQNEELQRVQEELADSRDRYFELYELAPVGYVTLDAVGRIVESNLTLATLLGVPRRKLTAGRPLAAFLTPASAGTLHTFLKRLLGARERASCELELARPDGGHRQARLDGVVHEALDPEAGAIGEGRVSAARGDRQARLPGRASGVPVPLCRAVLTDVTELKQAEQRIRVLNEELGRRVEELTQKNALLSAEMRQRAELAEAVERSRRELRLLSRRVISLQEEERQRLARELHDDTGQALGAVIAELRGLEDRATDPAVHEKVRAIRERVGAAMREVRRMSQGLHPAVLESSGLRPAIERLVNDVKVTHGAAIAIHFVGLHGGERFPPAVELTMFRIVQEALSNVVKHARARRTSVFLVRKERDLRLVVEDDGCGFDPEGHRPDGKPGLGLVGMRERVGLIGGELHVESAPGRGTAIAAIVPLAPNEALDGTPDPEPAPTPEAEPQPGASDGTHPRPDRR